MKRKLIILNTIILIAFSLVALVVGVSVTRKSHLEKAMSQIVTTTNLIKDNFNNNFDFKTPDEVRLTIIDESGKVIKDSSKKDVSEMENHLERPEIQSAKEGLPEVFVRKSSTLNRDMVYYALKVETTSGVFYLRTSLLVDSIYGYLKVTIPTFIIVLLLFVLIFEVVCVLSYNKMLKPLKDVQENLQKINMGTYKQIMPCSSDDQINKILTEINDLSILLSKSVKKEEEEKEKLELILKNITDGIIVLNKENNIELMNSQANTIFKTNVLNHAFSTLSSNLNFTNKVLESIENKEAKGFEISFDDGKIYLVNVRVLSSFTIIVLSDITTIVKNEQLRKSFFDNASHELKTPLTSIKAFNEMILIEAKDQKVKEMAKKEEKEINRIVKLINDMLDLSKLENMKEVVKENVQVEKVVDEVFESLTNLATNFDVSLYLEGSLNVVFNNEHMYELIKNLVENGIKYNRPKGFVKVFLNEKDLSLEVVDSGIGIDDESLKRIFERFYRVSKSRSRQSGGTGLGMSIVKHILELHSAKVEISSSKGIGTKIKIQFTNSSI